MSDYKLKRKLIFIDVSDISCVG